MAISTKQFILAERTKGTSDTDIVRQLRVLDAPEIKRGFSGSILPTLGGTAGGIIGGATASVPGAIAGAAVGQAIGETAQQSLEEAQGIRKEISPGQVAAAAATGAVFEAAGAGFGKAFSSGARAVAPQAKALASQIREPMIQFLSKISGHDRTVVETALQRTPGAVEAVKKGEIALTDLVKRSAQKLATLGRKTLEETRNLIANINRFQSLGRPGQKVARKIQLKEAGDFVGSVAKELRAEHNIGVQADGVLSFERPNVPSRIVAKSDQNTIQQSYQWLSSIKNNTSVKHLNAVLERLLVLSRKTPTGSPTGPETKAIVNVMIDRLKTVSRRLYPEYADVIESNMEKRILLRDAKELFGETANLTPQQIARTEKRILQLFNQGNLPVRQFGERVGKEIGEDISGTAAGTLIRGADNISIRAKNLTRRGVLERVVEALPRSAVQNYIRTGTITADVFQHPTILQMARILGVSAQTLVRQAITAQLEYTAQ